MTRRRAYAVLFAYAAIAGALAFACLGLTEESSPLVFVSSREATRVSYERFRALFGDDTFVVVTCRQVRNDERVVALAGSLRALPSVRTVDAPVAGQPLADALRLTGAGRRSLLVQLQGPQDTALADVRRTIAAFPDVAPSLAGQPVLNDALAAAAAAVGRRLFPLLALAMAVLLWLAYRSVAVVASVFGVTAVTVLVGMGVIALSGRPINLVTVLVPVLLMALTVALCIHVVNSYRRHRCVRREIRPCLVTTITTAAGFGSFVFSRIEPLRILGLAIAVGILAAFGIAFTLLPALFTLLRPKPREGLRLGALLVRVVPPVIARRRAVLVVPAMMVVAAAIVAPSVPRETDGMEYLPPSNPLRAETQRLRAEGVGTASLEYVLRPPPGQSGSALADLLPTLEARLAAIDGPVRGVVTPATLVRHGAARLGLRTTPEVVRLALARPVPVDESSLRTYRSIDPPALRVSLRTDPLDVDAFDALTARVERVLADVLAAAPGTTVEPTGELPVIMTVQRELLGTLLESLLVTLTTIFVVLTLAYRSPRIALTTILPAVLPFAAVVLSCAVLGIGLSVATVMVLAVTLGIVTDDSVHMVHVLRTGAPLAEALRQVGTAVAETSLAIMMGFAVLGLADFLPTRNFGVLTAVGVGMALVADVILFPVLLRSAAPRPAEGALPVLVPEFEA